MAESRMLEGESVIVGVIVGVELMGLLRLPALLRAPPAAGERP